MSIFHTKKNICDFNIKKRKLHLQMLEGSNLVLIQKYTNLLINLLDATWRDR
jgi:hypothetical protein